MDEPREDHGKTKLAWIQGKRGKRGKTGKPGEKEAIHPLRWRLLALWILVFSLLVGQALKDGREFDEKIQAERALSIKINCEQTNERNRRTIAALDARLEEAKKGATPDRLVQLQESRNFTASLINALAPHMNCADEIRRRVNPPKGEKPAKPTISTGE